MFKKILIICILLAIVLYLVFRDSGHYSAQQASRFITENAETKSHNCCALYVAKAMYAGGQPVPILRACDYGWYFNTVLPDRFVEVNLHQYKPITGDIAVFPSIENHFYGHISMWNGQQWVSDFKQKGLFVSPAYKNHKYHIFRPIATATDYSLSK